jgi:RNA polymerase sigma factor (sigma-70 family)
MIHAFIDTNIWVRVLTQGRPGCEIEHLDTLLAMCAEGKTILLLPEIVELEYEKQWRELTDEITREIGQLEQKIDAAIKPKLWTEIEDVHGAIRTLLQEAKQKKVEAAKAAFGKVQALFGSNQIVKLPLTANLLFLAKKRLIAGRMPRPDNQSHNDACIVESLLEYFRLSRDPLPQLCFCSENVNDFGLQTKEGVGLHPLIKDGLPATQYVTTLRNAVEFISSQPVVSEPSPAAIAEALEQQLMGESEPVGIELGESAEVIGCAAENCDEASWHIGPFCIRHLNEHLRHLPLPDQKRFNNTLEGVLKSLTYREREIFKLRTGLGDGYTYTLNECGRIFRLSASTIHRIEAKAIRKLRHPARMKLFEPFF